MTATLTALQAAFERAANADPGVLAAAAPPVVYDPDVRGFVETGGPPWVATARGSSRPHVAAPKRRRGSRVVTRTASPDDWDRWGAKTDPNSPAWRGIAARMDVIAALRRRLGPTRDADRRVELVAELDRQVALLPVALRGQYEGKWSV